MTFWRRRFVTVGCASAIALGGMGLLAGPAEGGSGEVTIKVSKQKSGGFAEDVEANLDEGQARNFYLKVRNTTAEAIPIRIGGSADPDLSAKWFKGFGGSKNVTAAVAMNDYERNLGPGKVTKFRWRIKLKNGGEDGCGTTGVGWPLLSRDTSHVLVNDPLCA